MPSDPAALLALAAKVNGLQNAGTEPLHIKATYQVIDDKGGVAETGTFEEIRFTAKKYKLTYSSPSISQTDYSTDAGLFRVGDSKWPDSRAVAARDILYPAFPSSEMIGKSRIKTEERKVGNTQLKCVTLDPAKAGAIGYHDVYCFSSAAPILRTVELGHGIVGIVYNGIVAVRGAYIAGDASSSLVGKLRVRVHLDVLNAMPHEDESVLTPPPGTAPITRRAWVGAGAMGNKIVRKAAPEYPAIARAAKIQGTVLLEAVIGKDGRIVEARAIGGPPMLQQASIDAVRKWVYEPYLLDGEPIEVETEINVVFSLGG